MSAKTDIMAVIARTDDSNMKAVLILMLAVLEEIGGEIRAMRADEQGLREAVLNGHSHVHDSHHEWLSHRIAANNCESTCKWVEERIEREKAEIENDEASRRKIRDALIERGLWAVLILAASSGWWAR